MTILNPWGILAAAMIVAAPAVIGCRGERVRPDSSGAAGAIGSSDPGPATRAVAESPRTVSEDPVAVIERFAPHLPIRLKLVAVARSGVLDAAMQDLARVFAFPLSLRGPEDLGPRLKSLVGFDTGTIGPSCILVWLEDDNAALVCDGGAVGRPPGATGWKAAGFSGHEVPYRARRVVAASGSGIVAIGSEAAVRQIAMASARLQPSFEPAMARMRAVIEAAGRGDPDHQVHVYFLDLEAAPWCRPRLCKTTGVFLSRERVLITAEAVPGLEVAVHGALEAFWYGTVLQPFERVEAGSGPSSLAVPQEGIKRAGLLAREGQVTSRGPLARLEGPGDPLFLAASLRPDLVLEFLGPPTFR